MADSTFRLDMTIFDALQSHPKVAEVLTSHGLTGCAFCHIGKVETLEQVCQNYDIDPQALLAQLEALKEEAEPSEAP